MAERERGLYWVKNAREWFVAHWRGDCWKMPGSQLPLADGDFYEIGERVERRSASSEDAIDWIERAISPPASFWQWPEPQPITDAQKNGERFLVWYVPSDRGANPGDDPQRENGWQTAWWDGEEWRVGGEGWEDSLWLEETRVNHYLPLPPDLKPSDR